MTFFRKGAASSPAPASDPRIPDGVRVYAIGDIHGRLDLLDAMLEKIANEARDVTNNTVRVIALGDMIDRGPHSRELIERFAVTGLPWQFDCLRGNHEALALACVDGRPGWELWLVNGGVETLFSYGVEARELQRCGEFDLIRERFLAVLPPAHLAFLRGLPTSLAIGDYFFCHAGVRPGVPLDRQSEQDLTWIRQEFLSSTAWHGKRVVHGHTPVMAAEILPNRINVDTGAVLTNRLSCAVLEGTSARILTA